MAALEQELAALDPGWLSHTPPRTRLGYFGGEGELLLYVLAGGTAA